MRHRDFYLSELLSISLQSSFISVAYILIMIVSGCFKETQ